jgi:hypothetical protein
MERRKSRQKTLFWKTGGLGDLKQTKDRSGFSKRRFKEFYERYEMMALMSPRQSIVSPSLHNVFR